MASAKLELSYKNKGKITKKNIAVIVDFNKPSNKHRLYILNLKKLSIESSSLVAHGKKSGGKYAQYFSNKSNSRKSSLGFYLTAETYIGKHGYSLKLDGLEKHLNSNARKRAIVTWSQLCFTKFHQKTRSPWSKLGLSGVTRRYIKTNN